MTTKKQEIRRLQRTVQHLRARIEELNELVGTERGRAEVLDNTAGFWEHQCGLWKKKAQALEAALAQEKRMRMKILTSYTAERPPFPESGEDEETAGAED